MALFTADALKEQLGYTGALPPESPQAYLDNLVIRADALVKGVIGRDVEQAERTEYYDGRGERSIELLHGPTDRDASLQLWTISYDSDGNETASVVSPGHYLLYGDLAEGWKLPSRLEMIASHFTTGQRNYKVTYTAGWQAIPADLEQWGLYAAVWLKNKRQDSATESRLIGDGSLTGFEGIDELIQDLRAGLAPYIPNRMF